MKSSDWLMEWKNKTLVDLWENACARFGDNEFIVFGDRRITYREMQDQVDRLACALVDLGIQKGDKIAIWMPNNPNWALAELATIKVGGIMVPLSTRFKSYDVEYILKQSDSVCLLMMERLGKINFFKILLEVYPELGECQPGQLRSEELPFLKNIVLFDETIKGGGFTITELLNGVGTPNKEKLLAIQSKILPEDVVNLPYTSGTTGFPKGVMTTHTQYLGQTVCFRERLGIREGDRFIAIAPFFANFGNYFGLLLPMITGGCSLMIEAYDPVLALRMIEKEKATHFSGTPTMYLDILNHPEFNQTNVSSLRTAMTGAAPAPVQMVREVYDKMGVEVICNGYGMTENSGCTTMTQKGDPPEILANTTGQPLLGVSICIKDLKTNEKLGNRQIGELCTKGWIVMKGYYKMITETEKCFDKEGWFHTGDLGMVDESDNFIITGRLKEMFISGGFNVYPVEVENFLYAYPGISLVAIVGVPDKRLGEVGIAFVVPKQGSTLTEEGILSFCRERIAGYKVPRQVVFVQDMPMAGVGKVQKYLLRENYLNP